MERKSRAQSNQRLGEKPGKALREETGWALLEAVPDAIFIMDVEGVILSVNGEAEELFGYARQELLGQCVEVLVPGYLCIARPPSRTLVGHHPPPIIRSNLCGRHKDGGEFSVEIHLNHLARAEGMLVVASIRNGRPRKRLKQSSGHSEVRPQGVADQLRQVEKGQLPGSPYQTVQRMAHDLNNALVPILGFTELALQPPGCQGSEELVMEYLQRIRHAAQDAAVLVQQLQEFCGQ